MIPTAHIMQASLGLLSVYWLCETGDSDDLTLLAPAEAAFLATLRAPKRRRDWLLGRRVAKRLIQTVLADRLGQSLPLNQIVILRHADGWPHVSLSALGSAAPPLTLSISHSRDRAFCALVLGDEQRLGCDIEAIEPRSPGFVADYFTADERAHMAAAPDDQRPTLANAIWSGKEAALKAIRRGLAEDTRLVTCIPSMDEATDGWRLLGYRWEAAGRPLPALAGRWREWKGFVMTIALTRPPP